MTDETTGTPAQDGGDAAGTPTTGTPDADGRDATSGEPDYKAMYLSAKEKVERANTMEAELKELRARSEPPPAAHDDDDDEADESVPSVDWKKVQAYADAGDEVARAQIANRKLQLELARNVRDSFHLRDISDTSERQEVLKHYHRNRHRLGDVKAAEAEVRKMKLETENADLRKQLEAAKKQPPTDVVRTHSREVSASEAKSRPKMTYAQFDQQKAALESQGKLSEARALAMKLERDEIEIE